MQFMKTHLFAVTALLLGTAPVWSAEPNTTAPAAAPLPAGERGKVDINTADIPTLEAIPEIGTNFANAVVAARPFKSVEDLDRVLKLGPEDGKTPREGYRFGRENAGADRVRPAAGNQPADDCE